jgi:signal transduction histidine kinase
MREWNQWRPLRQLGQLRHKGVWVQKIAGLAQHLPRAYRQGKMPYIFFFVSTVLLVLLTYAAVSPYQHATISFTALSAWLVVLLVLVNYGMPLNWGIHMGTVAGAFMLVFAVYSAGGVFSPRFSWLLILPLTPFFVISRKAGAFWLGVVLCIQLALAWANVHDALPPFELSRVHAPSSWLTFSLITGMLMIVPMIYERLHRKAVEESRQYQAELEAKRLELERTLQMREHFIATVSHELRTPMNAILGFNTLLLSRVKGKPEALKVLNHTRQSADHLMTVINDILDYSQLQAGQLTVQPETFELRETVAQAFALFRPRVDSMSLDYRLEMDEAVPAWVHTDRHRLTQILVNLLGNALKFTHQGLVLLRVAQDGPTVVFSVQDTGIGIAQERQAKIFNRFTQADGDIHAIYGGNGLGLAISQKLAGLLGGAIGFESELGRGSRFWLKLPLVSVDAPTQPAKSLQTELKTADQAWKFLVVDDHPINRLLVKQVLQNTWPACTVLEAADGQQAIDSLATQAIDLVLMDMVMPVMDGIAATQAVRQSLPEALRQTPVIGLTANVTPQDLERFEAAGLNALMLKPFEPGTLCEKIEGLLSRS